MIFDGAYHMGGLAYDPKYSDKLTEMEALLLSEMERFDDPCRLGVNRQNRTCTITYGSSES